jgi:nucleotide-binding universal stress UspA family protein
MKKIFIPVDGSKFAEASIPTAIGIATRAGAEVRLTMVGVPQDPPSGVWADSFRDNHLRYLEELTERVKEAGPDVVVSSQLLNGEVTGALAKEITEWGADMVVMTTHGRGGLARAWLGSVADALIRSCAVPVLLVRPEDSPEGGPQWTDPLQVVVTVDGTAFAETALQVATDLATLYDARITLVRIVPYPYDVSAVGGGMVVDYSDLLATAEAEGMQYLADLTDRIEGLVPRVDGELLVSSSPASGILDIAARREADVVVVASHRRGGFSRLVLGSTTDKLVRGAQRSVLVVPVREPDADG